MEGESSKIKKPFKKNASKHHLCGFCKSETAKYCCPRCKIPYCSLPCYTSEKHLECSEGFYEDCVKENLQDCEGKEKDKAKMLEILQRDHEANQAEEAKQADEALDSDDEEFSDLGDRLAGVNLDDAESIWAKLNETERQEFEAFLKSGDVTKYIEPWEPWWVFHSHKKVVDLSQISSYKSKCPKLLEPIKDILNITQVYPAEQVRYNIINVLTAYAFTTRFFNGDYKEFPRESVSCITNLALTLKVNHNFDDFATAVESVHCQVMSNSSWISADEENIKTMREDIHKLLKGPHKSEKKYYVYAALSDFYRLLEVALKENKAKKTHDDGFSKKFPDTTFPPVIFESKDKLKRYMKKIEFYLAYVKDCWQIN